MRFGLFVAISICSGLVASEMPPIESLPPTPRPLVLDPLGGQAKKTTDDRKVDRAGLMADINALARSRDRVRRLLVSNQIEGMSVEEAQAQLDYKRPAAEQARVQGSPDGPIEKNTNLEPNILHVQRLIGGGADVTARIRDERVEHVYRELMTMIRQNLDDQRVSVSQRMVSLHVTKLPWQETLHRLLGQVGLAYRIEEDKVVIFDQDKESYTSLEFAQLAEKAYHNAASDRSDPYAAEALYRMAEEDMNAGRYYAAMEGYLDIVEHFDQNTAAMAPARPWVRKSVRAYGDALMELKQYADARGVYLNYISKAEENDPELPNIYFAAAEASRLLGRGNGEDDTDKDPAALAQSNELLQTLITRFGSDVESQQVVTKARITLGRLLFDEQDYAGAQKYFVDHMEESRRDVNDEITYYLAECDYFLAIEARRRDQHGIADAHLDNALTRFDALVNVYQSSGGDSDVPEYMYRNAFNRIGQCHLIKMEPDYVKALFAFLRARQRFQDGKMEAEVVVNIARCYAEMQIHAELKRELYKILATKSLHDSREGKEQIEQLISDVKTHLKDFNAQPRVKVLFYIAQAKVWEAERHPDENERIGLLLKAVSSFERVIKEGGGGSIVDAAKLRLAQAAAQAGDDERAEQTFLEILRDNRTQPRDIELAAQMLGNFYRKRGRLTDAINAYQAFRGDEAE